MFFFKFFQIFSVVRLSIICLSIIWPCTVEERLEKRVNRKAVLNDWKIQILFYSQLNWKEWFWPGISNCFLTNPSLPPPHWCTQGAKGVNRIPKRNFPRKLGKKNSIKLKKGVLPFEMFYIMDPLPIILGKNIPYHPPGCSTRVLGCVTLVDKLNLKSQPQRSSRNTETYYLLNTLN